MLVDNYSELEPTKIARPVRFPQVSCTAMHFPQSWQCKCSMTVNSAIFRRNVSIAVEAEDVEILLEMIV